MAKLYRDGAKERWWRELLSRQAASGLSVRAFCRREGLGEASFYAWRRTITERDREPTKAPPFVPVVISDQPQSSPSIVMELTGGRVLKLPPSTPAAWLAELVLALEVEPDARAER